MVASVPFEMAPSGGTDDRRDFAFGLPSAVVARSLWIRIVTCDASGPGLGDVYVWGLPQKVTGTFRASCDAPKRVMSA